MVSWSHDAAGATYWDGVTASGDLQQDDGVAVNHAETLLCVNVHNICGLTCQCTLGGVAFWYLNTSPANVGSMLELLNSGGM